MALIRRKINNLSEVVAPDIIIDAEDIMRIGETPISYAPMVRSGPYNLIDGATGSALLVEDGHTNLLLNSSFELAVLTNWTSNNVTATASTELNYHKYYSAKLTSTANGTNHYIEQQVAASPSAGYVASCWVNMPESGVIGTGNSSKGASLVIREINAGSTQVAIYETSLDSHSSSGWQKLSVSFTATGTTANIQLRLHVYDAGPAYFDAVQLTKTNANLYPTSFIDGMNGVGYSFSGIRDNSTSVRTDSQIYINTSDYNMNNSGMTALVWARPLWDWDKSDIGRAYTPFAITNDVGTGVSFQYNASRNFEVLGNATASIVAGNTFRFSADEQLVFGVKVDGSNNTWGFLGKKHNNVYRDLVSSHSNLVSYWRLNEPAPTSTTSLYYKDSKGTNHLDATLGASKTGLDKTDGALNNDGNAGLRLYSSSGSSVTRAYSLSLNAAVFSIEFWLKVDSFTTSVYRNFFRSYDASNQGYLCEFAPAAKLFNFYIGTGSTTSALASSTLKEGIWYHYVGLYNGTKQQLYENGKLKAEATVAFSPDTNAAFQLFPSTTEGMISLDECSYYNIALTEKEIWEHYSASNNYMVYKTVTNGTMSANTPTRLYLGNNYTGTNWLDGYIDGALIFNKALTDERIFEYIQDGFTKNTDALLTIDNTMQSAEVASVSISTPSINEAESYVLSDENSNYKVVWNKI